MFEPRVVVAFVASYGVAGVLATVLAAYAHLYHRERPVGRAFALLAASLGAWTLAALARAFASDPGVRAVLTAVEHLGIVTAPVWLLLFAVLYAEGKWLAGPRRTVALLVVPALALVGAVTAPLHGLFYRSTAPRPVEGLLLVETTPGPGALAFAIYAYGFVVLATLLLAYAVRRRTVFYRMQSVVVLLGITVPWIAEAARVEGVWPYPAVDPRPVALVAGSCLFALGALGTRLVDVFPSGRAMALDALEDGVVVLDRERRVVGLNDAAEQLVTAAAPVGAPVDAVLPPALSLRRSEPDEEGRVRELERDGETRFYRQQLLPLDGDQGSVLVLADVTEERRVRERSRRRQRFLRRQNERLEEFAASVSHDLRNPLNVAAGNLELVREECDSDELDRIESAHDRMEVLIEDVLTLARQGRAVGETEAVPLAEVAERAWAAVPADGATLDLEDGLGTVQADADRLDELFENLFRNAVEHAGTGVTVSVGSTGDGFYVEDDGPGIPAEKRDRVFDHGYTTADEGTGFGLSIVQSIAEAHGWRIEATEATDGGARFEVDASGRAGEL